MQTTYSYTTLTTIGRAIIGPQQQFTYLQKEIDLPYNHGRNGRNDVISPKAKLSRGAFLLEALSRHWILFVTCLSYTPLEKTIVRFACVITRRSR